MGTAREFIYSILTHPEVAAFIGGETNPRVFAKKSMTSSREQHPYIVYKLGNETNENLAEDQLISRQFVQVFVHDFADTENGDYLRIDQVILAIKKAAHLASSGEHGVWSISFLEVSQDLDDNTLETVMKYIRFQVIKEDQ